MPRTTRRTSVVQWSALLEVAIEQGPEEAVVHGVRNEEVLGSADDEDARGAADVFAIAGVDVALHFGSDGPVVDERLNLLLLLGVEDRVDGVADFAGRIPAFLRVEEGVGDGLINAKAGGGGRVVGGLARVL